jgi:hypothetical protein
VIRGRTDTAYVDNLARVRGYWTRPDPSRLMRRSLARRLGLRRSEPLVRTHVEAVKALTEAALAGDEAAVTVLLAAIDYELGDTGYYTTCCLLAERILRAEGIATPTSRPRLRRRLVTMYLVGPGGELMEPPAARHHPAGGRQERASCALEFVTAYGNGDSATLLDLWARIRDHPDRGYRTAFVVEFLAVAADVLQNRQVNPVHTSD